MAKLTAEQLKALPDSMFGLPKERKYPMPDEEHVRKAIQFFRYCEESKRSELAKNINRRAKELKMKLKIQPSSAFYKYADKEILKEGLMIVDEFHIGQLSPIVPIERPVLKHRMLSKNNSKPPIERLKNLWDSKKALDIKKEVSLNILDELLTEHAEISLDIFKQFNAISDLCYMLESGLGQYVRDVHPFQQFINLKGRINDNDNYIYNEIIVKKSMPFGDIKYNFSQIKDPAILAKAVSYINYSDIYTKEEKDEINQIFLLRNQTKDFNLPIPNIDSNDHFQVAQLSYKDGITEDEEFIINSFLEKMESKYSKVISTTRGLYKKDCTIIGIDKSVWDKNVCSWHLSAMKAYFNIGYYLADELVFITLNGCIYTGEFVKIITKPQHFFDNGSEKKSLLLLKIYDPNNEEYFENVISYLQGAHMDMKLWVKTIDVNDKVNESSALEAADFNSLINGIKISKNGTVSLVFNFNFSWKEKLAICKNAIKECKDNKDTEGLKNNLAFIFSMINYIQKVYIKEVDSLIDNTGNDYKDAMDTLNEGLKLFKSELDYITKIDKKFDFINYYMKTKYNDKINIFDSEDNDELKKEVGIAYYWCLQ